MRIAMLLVFALSASLVNAATGYRSVDPSGEVIFSDTPAAGAQPIHLPDAQTYDPAAKPAKPAAATPAKKPPASVPDVEPVPYESLTIVQPTANQTLNYRPAGVPVLVTVKPALQKGDRVEISFDGEKVSSGAELGVNVPNVYRGAHTVSARVVNQAGATLISSSMVTFYVVQHSILNK